MCKYRTAFQDFTFIKGLIDNEKTINFVEEAKKEGITFWKLHSIYKKFILTNYLSNDRSKEQKNNVAEYLEKGNHYTTRYDAIRGARLLRNKDMNLSSKEFKKTTWKTAIAQLKEIAEIRSQLIKKINLHCKNDTTYSDDFEELCKNHSVIPYMERARKRKEGYPLTIPTHILEERKAKKEKKEKEKKERFEREEKRKNLLKIEKAREERIFTVTKTKADIRYLKKLST